MKKITIYYLHRESMGHTMRVKNLAEILSQEFEVEVINGGCKQDIEFPDEVKFHQLPCPYYSKKDFRIKEVFITSSQIRSRTSKIKEIIGKSKPDIFVSEFFPFGRHEARFEFAKILPYLTKQGIEVYGSIGYPELTSEMADILHIFWPYYKKVLIHSPQEELDQVLQKTQNPKLLNTYNNIFYTGKDNKIFFTGYIEPLFWQKNIQKEHKNRTLVNRGGGAVDPKIIAKSIIAANYLPEEYQMTAITGPSTSKREWKIFSNLIRKNSKDINLIKSLTPEEFFAELSSCELAVTMGGYNTLTQLLYLQKPAIIFPYSQSEQRKGYWSEQEMRSSLFEKHFPSLFTSFSEMPSSKEFADLITKKIENKKEGEPKTKEWFSSPSNIRDSFKKSSQ